MATKPKSASVTPTTAGKATGTAVAVKSVGSNIVNIQEMLHAQAAAMNEKTAPATGNFIRLTQDKQFVLPDGTKTPGPLQLVIVDFTSSNKFYEAAYDKDSIVPPACFAIGSNPLKLAPSPNAPLAQATDCQSCPMNQWGSDGKGKACKNTRILAVLPPEADADTPLWMLATSPTANKGFDGYVNSVARMFQTPPVGVVTTVSFDANETYAKLVFSDPQPNPEVGVHFSRQEEAREALQAEPDVSGFKKEAPVARKGAKVAGRR